MNLIPPALAQIRNPVLINEEHATNPVGYTQNAIQVIVTIFISVGVIYFLWHFMMAAYHMMSTEGDSKKFEEARHEVTYAFVGLIIVFSVFAVIKFVGYVTGIEGLDNLQLTFPSLGN